MRYVIGIAVGTLLIFYGAKIYFFHQVQLYLSTLGFPADHVLFDFLTKQSRVMDLIFGGAALVESLFLAWMGLKLSHKVAGPLFRLRKEMERVGEGGEIVPLKFRDGDYFEELADAYNGLSKAKETSRAA
ncbi:MAG: hypothetical protein ACXWPM_11100 [Bdellovibrionota bacterium]